ncbi:hypothetical protein BFP97_12360 [Roseivirga sp. 4D4]|uniref:hypothetical protein n=1 Tax=Roseivirga sp. 4D4 TaxID=1889784 RepID=UPI00085352DF|nr:hypothetical protein [Roseivirga sp. 4D4]OEK02261.1 hypothetical protein BFP97_12360 [Roseivirga sp. 4D4]
MKKLITALLLVTVCISVQAQKKVREKDILGEWELVIDMDHVKDEVEEELEEEEFWLARSFAKSVSNFALDIVESIDVRFDFRDNGEVKISVKVFGERETEWAEWYINDDGELIIEDEDDHRRRRSRNFSMGYSNDNDVWLLEDGKLHSYDKDRRGRLERQEVYLKRR